MTQRTRTPVGEWIGASRKRVGWTQAKLGRLLDLSQGTISQWETGRSEPSEEGRLRMDRLFEAADGQLKLTQEPDPTPRAEEAAGGSEQPPKRRKRRKRASDKSASALAGKKEKYDDARPQHAELLRQLWEAAVNLRGSIEPADYKRYVLPIIFLRFLSVRFEQRQAQLADEVREPASPYFAESAEERAFVLEDADSYRSANVFPVPEEARWEELRKHAQADDVKIRLDLRTVHMTEVLEDIH